MEPRSRTPPEATSSGSLFQGIEVDKAVRAIHTDAVFTDIRLPDAVTREIERFCRSEPLFARQDPDGPTFLQSEVRNGFTPDGRPVAIGPITEPTRCPAVRAVVEDPLLRSVATEYLRYAPKKVLPLLYWSFASSFSDDERRRLKQHVIDYHYDVSALNFVYASFYIVDCTLRSGAHSMIRGSHNRKPLRMLCRSAVASADSLYTYYGRHSEMVIEGPAGSGFIQDTSCYHRASPPTTDDRLMLQIRFS